MKHEYCGEDCGESETPEPQMPSDSLVELATIRTHRMKVVHETPDLVVHETPDLVVHETPDLVV